MFSKIVSFPFVAAALILLYLNWTNGGEYTYYLIPVVIVLAIIYALSPQIDWWWYERHPPLPHKGIIDIFQKKFPAFQRLAPKEKTKFLNRVQLFIHAKEFMPKGWENVPEDIKAMIAASAVLITMNKEAFLPPDFDMYVVYPGAFPSPQHPRSFHASEIYEPDGVALFSGEHILKSFIEPQRYYNVGLHEFAKIYMHNHPEIDWESMPLPTWEQLEEVSGFPEKGIKDWMGIEDVPQRAVSISHYFMFPERMKEVLPELYGRYHLLFSKI